MNRRSGSGGPPAPIAGALPEAALSSAAHSPHAVDQSGIATPARLGSGPPLANGGPAASPLWSRDFILIVVGSGFLFFGFQSLLAALPLYAVELGGGNAAAGLIVGLFTLSAVLVRPVAGWALDTMGRRLVYTLGLVVFIICVLAYGFAGSIVALLVLRFIHGIPWGVSTTAGGTVASDLIPHQRLGEGMGYFGWAVTAALGIAPVVGLAIVDHWGFWALFIVAAASVGVCLTIVSFIRYPPVAVRSTAEGRRSSPYERSSLAPALVMLLVSTTWGVVVGFIALFGKQHGVENVGPFFIVYAVSLTLVRPIAGRLADRVGYGRVVVPGIIVTMVSMAVMAGAQGPWWFIAVGALFGIGYGAAQPCLQAMCVLGVPPDRRGAASATYYTALDAGIGVGAIIGGFIAGALGYPAMFLSILVPLAASLFVYRRMSAGRGEAPPPVAAG